MIRIIYAFILLFQLTFTCGMQAQWQQTNGPRGGIATCFVSDDDEIYAGTQYGGIFRSTNEGASWIVCNNGLKELNVHTLYNDNETIYAGTGVNGLYSSSDNGSSWESFPSFWSSYSLSAIAVDGVNIYTGNSGGGLIVSNDNGQTWSYTMDGIIPALYYIVQKIVIHSQNVFCVINGRVYMSSNNGISWTTSDAGIPIATVMSIFDTGTSLIASTNGGVYISFDAGLSWTATEGDLPNMPYGMIMTVAGENLFVSDSYYEGLYFSNDNGENWVEINFTPQNTISNIHVLNNGHLLVQTSNTAFGVLPTEQPALYLTTDNGITWSDVTHEITSSNCLALAVQGDLIYAGTFGLGIFSTQDEGDSWSPLGLTYGYLRSVHAFGNTVLAGGDIGIQRSTDNGLTWANSSQGLTNASISGFTHIDNNIFAATGGGVFISTNDGQSWDEQSNGISESAVLTIHAMDLTLFAGTQNGIYISTNFGNSWDNISNGLPANAGVFDMVNIGSMLIISVDGYGLYASSDNGASWTNIYVDQAVMALQNAGDLIFAAIPYEYDATQESVIMSSDLGVTWVYASEGLTNNLVTDFAVVNDFIYATTRGGGVFKRPLSDFEEQSVGEESGELFGLYPNPASTDFTIHISSTLVGEGLSIYNALGQCVMSVNQVNALSSQIDCSTLSPGIYVVEVGGLERKLVIEK